MLTEKVDFQVFLHNVSYRDKSFSVKTKKLVNFKIMQENTISHMG